MYVVAVTRWGPGLQEQLPELAAMLGLFPYDLRMRLNGPLPVIVARMPEQGPASALMAKLRGWGHGAVGCALSTVPSASEMFTPREFAFDEAAGTLELRGTGRALSVRPEQVHALIHAMALTETRTTRETTSKKFSAARAVATGGMVMRKKQTQTSTSTESEWGEQLYLVLQSKAAKAAPVLLTQHGLRYAGLGEAKSHSSLTSFATLVERLRAFAPHAFYDRRLVESRRKPGFVGASRSKVGKAKQEAVAHSNAGGVDLAARLLLIAHSRGQL